MLVMGQFGGLDSKPRFSFLPQLKFDSRLINSEEEKHNFYSVSYQTKKGFSVIFCEAHAGKMIIADNL